MKGRILYASLVFAMILSVAAFGQDAKQRPSSRHLDASGKSFQGLDSISPAYRQKVLALLIAEANKVAGELQLPENLPVTETNLISSYTTPPRLVAHLGGAVGNLATSNYEYYCSVGGKFSFLTRKGLEREYVRFRRESRLPISLLDTNAAYQMAITWLTQAKMDVTSLNRDCEVRIRAQTIQVEKAEQFVPVYWVYWKRRGQTGSAASVQLFAPKRILLDLRVEDSKYILRQPLPVDLSP